MCFPVRSLWADGGAVHCLELLAQRTYPALYSERLAGGGVLGPD